MRSRRSSLRGAGRPPRWRGWTRARSSSALGRLRVAPAGTRVTGGRRSPRRRAPRGRPPGLGRLRALLVNERRRSCSRASDDARPRRSPSGATGADGRRHPRRRGRRGGRREPSRSRSRDRRPRHDRRRRPVRRRLRLATSKGCRPQSGCDGRRSMPRSLGADGHRARERPDAVSSSRPCAELTAAIVQEQGGERDG